MRTPARIGKHPLHPMSVALPIGLWAAAFAFDVLHIWRGDELWGTLAFYNLAAGLIGALAAAIPGFVDYVSLNDETVLRIAHWHFGVTLTTVTVYAVNFWLRTEAGKGLIGDTALVPFLLSSLGMLLVGFSGWLGGELVFAHGVAVEVEPGQSTGQRDLHSTSKK